MEGRWWEIEGRGRCPEEGQEEFIRAQVRTGDGRWAIAYALLAVARVIERRSREDDRS